MDYSKSKNDEKLIFEFQTTLLSLKPIDTNAVFFLKEKIPEKIGVYLWSTKDEQIVYVGSAIGEKSRLTGLYRRIVTELLNPNYLLPIKKNNLKSDSYQLRHPAYTKRAKKPAIDKNAFRKNIGRIENIPPGEPTVNFIKSNFFLRFIVVPSKEIAKKIETKLIAKKQPKYNIQGK